MASFTEAQNEETGDFISTETHQTTNPTEQQLQVDQPAAQMVTALQGVNEVQAFQAAAPTNAVQVFSNPSVVTEPQAQVQVRIRLPFCNAK